MKKAAEEKKEETPAPGEEPAEEGQCHMNQLYRCSEEDICLVNYCKFLKVCEYLVLKSASLLFCIKFRRYKIVSTIFFILLHIVIIV